MLVVGCREENKKWKVEKMLKKKGKRKRYKGMRVVLSFLLILQTMLFFSFETLAKKTTATSSSSVTAMKETTKPSLGKAETKKSSASSESKETEDSKEAAKTTSNQKNSLTASPLAALNDGITPLGSLIGTVPQNGLTYQVWSDGKAGVSAASKTGISQNVIIPATVVHNGVTYKVVHIYAGVFKDNTKIQTLSFADGNNLERIDKGAFENCTNLTSVDLSNCSKLAEIQDEAFKNSIKVAVLKLPDNAISVLDRVGVDAFRDCFALKNTVLTIPDSVREIGDRAFLLNEKYSRYSEIKYKKVASVTGSLPDPTAVEPVTLPDASVEALEGYESKVDSSEGNTLLHKAAKWTNDDLTTAEIRIDYGDIFESLTNLDVVFVTDHSGSMASSTLAKDIQGNEYLYPRGFLTTDILRDASKMLISGNQSKYDNRVALVGFSREDEPNYKSDGFTNDYSTVENFLDHNPNYSVGHTHYGVGLQAAINNIDEHSTDDRHPVVIFLSDGEPADGTSNPSDDYKGIQQAQELRDRGVKVYPVGIYMGSADLKALEDISYDKKTVYDAQDTDSFQQIMKQILGDIITQVGSLSVNIEDVISDKFELLTGEQSDISVSPNGGDVTIEGQKLTWDLTGCDQGVAHTLTIQVKLKGGSELTETGELETNRSLKATDESIQSSEQPKLTRYLGHHRFEYANDPSMELPQEVRDLLPESTGGYRDTAEVTPTAPKKTEVKDSEGRLWTFLGWDENKKIINGQDVTFVGKWRYKKTEFSFIKLNESNQGLAEADFSLYVWKGPNVPTNNERVNDESIADGRWELIGTAKSQANGLVSFQNLPVDGTYFQLVETKAPVGYMKSQGQWRLTFDSNGHFDLGGSIGIAGEEDNLLPPAFELINDGQFKDYYGVKNRRAQNQLPETGGIGRLSGFFVKTAILWSIGTVLTGWYYYNRRTRM